MQDTKFIKAKCEKTGKRFGLEIKKFGLEWKVVNFINLTEAEAAVITSEVKQRKFVTNANLQPCKKCGKRIVGGCACAKKTQNCRADRYDFQCVYCENLQIDYTAATETSGYKDGEVIRLSQGQEVKIKFADNRPLTQIEVGLGWDPTRNGNNMDIDSSVIVANQTSYEKVYFGNLKHSSGCVVHHGDNLTGEGDGGNSDDENITVYLNKVPANRTKLIFVLNIYKCKDRRQQLGDVKNMYLRLYDPVSKQTLIKYAVDANMSNCTALIIGMAYRKGSDWLFKAIGKGSRAADLNELAEEVMRMR